MSKAIKMPLSNETKYIDALQPILREMGRAGEQLQIVNLNCFSRYGNSRNINNLKDIIEIRGNTIKLGAEGLRLATEYAGYFKAERYTDAPAEVCTKTYIVEHLHDPAGVKFGAIRNTNDISVVLYGLADFIDGEIRLNQKAIDSLKKQSLGRSKRFIDRWFDAPKYLSLVRYNEQGAIDQLYVRNKKEAHYVNISFSNTSRNTYYKEDRNNYENIITFCYPEFIAHIVSLIPEELKTTCVATALDCKNPILLDICRTLATTMHKEKDDENQVTN